MKFACDSMLGRLARWLRLSGYDVTYRGEADRAAFMRAAREQGRTILTRATWFDELADIPPYRLLAGDDLDGQLRQVYDAFPEMDPYCDFLSRCVDCNEPLEEIAKDDFKDSIPPKAMQLEGRFSRCPSCGKLLWPGTHIERIKHRLNALKRD
jgi:uncharacterized protein with PIN domain